MKTLMTAAFALSLMTGASANAQPHDDHHPAGPARPAPHAPSPRPGPGPQISHGNAPPFSAPQGRPQGQVQPQGYQGRPQGQVQPQGPAPRPYGPAPRNYPRGPGGGHEWNAGQRFRGPAYAYPRGFGYREWAFGEYLPGPFFISDYVIYDYWDYGLPAPPYGFEWVRVGADALLVRPVDGYILDVAHNLFW